MRILMTASSSSLMDGINRHILAIAPALNALSDVEVAVVTLHPWSQFNEMLKAAGVRCYSLECSNGHQLNAVLGFRRVMREFKPDLVHIHVLAFGAAVALRWFYGDVKSVVTVHGISDPVAKRTWRMRLEGWLGRVARIVPVHYICISRGVMKAYAFDASKRTVIYNPMPFDGGEKPSRSQCIVGTACRVDHVKNPLAFTRVLGEVTKRIPHVEGWVVGDGPALAACRELARENGYDKMRFWGMRNDAKDLIAQMDCFVMTSKREGMPGALLEAMSVKTPIAFMKGEGGLGDLVEMNENEGPFAVIADQGDEAALINGVCELLSNRERARQYAERAFEVGKLHFDIAIVVKQLHDVYAKVLGT